MNKNEKGYFVKFVHSQGGNSDYLKLFTALCNLPTYNQETLIREFKGSGFLKNIAYSQNYLYRMILKSLRLYYEKQQIDIQLYASLAEVNVLEIKGLTKQSASLLKSIKKKALKYHQYSILIEVLKKQAMQLVATRGPHILEATLNTYTEIFEALAIMEEELTYHKLKHSILLYFRHGASTAPQQFTDLLKSISDHPAMNDDLLPRSFYSQYLKHSIRSIEARIYGDRKIAYTNQLKILEIWEAHPAIVNASPHLYKIHISNFLGNAILINEIGHFEKYVQIMEGMKPRNQKDKIETFQNIIYFRSLFYLNQNQLNEGSAYIESVENQIISWADKLNPARAIAIYYNIVMLYFLAEDFEKGLHWVNLILDKQDKTIRSDVKLFARIMNMIIHFELNNDQLLDYLHISTRRKINEKSKNPKGINDYEKTILKHFKKIINMPRGKESIAAFKIFKNDLASFQKEAPKPISVEELLIWLQARINNKSLQSVYAQTLKDNRAKQ